VQAGGVVHEQEQIRMQQGLAAGEADEQAASRVQIADQLHHLVAVQLGRAGGAG
jgi:hypothetical protein